VTMLPFVAATCSSAGSSLASGSRRRAGMNDPSVRSHGDCIVNQRTGAWAALTSNCDSGPSLVT
jgi:hypothetical protein